MTIDSPEATDFDYFQPFEADSGSAAVIAGWLRQNGHPTCTAALVTAELGRPDSERTIIGRFASALLYQTCWRP